MRAHLEANCEVFEVLLLEGSDPILQAGCDAQHDRRKRCKDLTRGEVQIDEILCSTPRLSSMAQSKAESL
jgi:hypothetical protein